MGRTSGYNRSCACRPLTDRPRRWRRRSHFWNLFYIIQVRKDLTEALLLHFITVLTEKEFYFTAMFITITCMHNAQPLNVVAMLLYHVQKSGMEYHRGRTKPDDLYSFRVDIIHHFCLSLLSSWRKETLRTFSDERPSMHPSRKLFPTKSSDSLGTEQGQPFSREKNAGAFTKRSQQSPASYLLNMAKSL